jgi:hypothetical protein
MLRRKQQALEGELLRALLLVNCNPTRHGMEGGGEEGLGGTVGGGKIGESHLFSPMVSGIRWRARNSLAGNEEAMANW